MVRASFDESPERYGSPLVHEDLLEQQIHVSRKRVVRLMQEKGLRARVRKRFKATTMSDHDQPVAANLLVRRFQAPGPNQRWVGDTTEFVIGGSGTLYLAAVLDLFSRFVVGWELFDYIEVFYKPAAPTFNAGSDQSGHVRTASESSRMNSDLAVRMIRIVNEVH